MCVLCFVCAMNDVRVHESEKEHLMVFSRTHHSTLILILHLLYGMKQLVRYRISGFCVNRMLTNCSHYNHHLHMFTLYNKNRFSKHPLRYHVDQQWMPFKYTLIYNLNESNTHTLIILNALGNIQWNWFARKSQPLLDSQRRLSKFE